MRGAQRRSGGSCFRLHWPFGDCLHAERKGYFILLSYCIRRVFRVEFGVFFCLVYYMRFKVRVSSSHMKEVAVWLLWRATACSGVVFVYLIGVFIFSSRLVGWCFRKPSEMLKMLVPFPKPHGTGLFVASSPSLVSDPAVLCCSSSLFCCVSPYWGLLVR